MQTPTAFVVLRQELPSENEQQQMLELTPKEDGSGFELGGELGEMAKARFEEGKTWWERVTSLAKGVSEGDAEQTFGAIEAGLGDLVTGQTMYLYLIDDLTGLPVRDASGKYPIKITKPAEVVPKLLPVMQVGMHALSVFNGVAGVARMFGAPVPSVPADWQRGAQKSVELLKQESSVEAFGAVHASTAEGNENGVGARRVAAPAPSIL